MVQPAPSGHQQGGGMDCCWGNPPLRASVTAWKSMGKDSQGDDWSKRQQHQELLL